MEIHPRFVRRPRCLPDQTRGTAREHERSTSPDVGRVAGQVRRDVRTSLGERQRRASGPINRALLAGSAAQRNVPQRRYSNQGANKQTSKRTKRQRGKKKSIKTQNYSTRIRYIYILAFKKRRAVLKSHTKLQHWTDGGCCEQKRCGGGGGDSAVVLRVSELTSPTPDVT